MTVVDRVRNILVTPRTEWPIIAAEPATVGSIYRNYAAIVALLPVLGMLIGTLIFASGFGLAFTIVPAVIIYAVGLGLLYVMALIADAVSPGFGGTRSQVQAMKLVAYSATPQWVAGFFAFIPGLSIILSLIGFAYGAYLLYLGSMSVMGVPEAKAPAYTAVLIVLWIVLSMIVTGAIVGAVVGALLGGGLAFGGGYVP